MPEHNPSVIVLLVTVTDGRLHLDVMRIKVVMVVTM
jgi:hypothetical protein